MSEEREPLSLQQEADQLLRYIITEMDLSPPRALAVSMATAAMIVASADEVPALIGNTKRQALADFEEMIDTLLAERNLEQQKPEGTA